MAALLLCAACGGENLTVAERLGQQLARARNSEEIANVLRRYRGEGGDESLLVSSFCSVATTEINGDDPPSGEDWVQNLATKGAGVPDLNDTFDRLDAGLSLAERTNGGVEARYWQACKPYG